MEPDQVHVLAAAVLRHLQQVDEAGEARGPRELRRDVGQRDPLDRVDLDRAFAERVASADLDARALPDAHAARDLAAADAVVQALREGQRTVTSTRRLFLRPAA